jgi:uncharacterized protein (DUF302 family)
MKLEGRIARRFAVTALAVCIGASLPFGIGLVGGSSKRGSSPSHSQHIEFWQTALGENAMVIDGMKTLSSPLGAKETMDQLESVVKSKGLTVFARVDHAAGATAVGMDLRPTQLLIFGNARGGTPLMQADQRIGIDLPLKALVYEDDAGKVWLSYVDLHWLAQRYALSPSVAANVDALSKVLDALASAAIKAQ